MSYKVIKELNTFKTFKFDVKSKRIVNLRDSDTTNIDEFLSIQHILDANRIAHSFEKNFNIKVLG